MKMAYYPGCSLEGSAKDCDRSVRDVAARLGVELVELEDWSCCGASSAHMTNQRLGILLGARNLLIAERTGLDVLVPCSACYQRLKAADHALRADPVAWEVERYEPEFEIVHLSRFLVQPQVLALLKERVTHPLSGLKAACYYGCLSLRPPDLTGAADAEQPQALAQVMEALGVEAVPWSHATECCGGSLTVARPDISRQLVGDLVTAARRGGADVIVTDCPMCQANLESRQLDLAENENLKMLPVMFPTELALLALAEEKTAPRFPAHLIDPGPALMAALTATEEAHEA